MHNTRGTMDESEIVNFYHGRSVFITGGTGFLGKATVEKLLRTVPQLKAIYLLIRSSRTGLGPKARLAELIDSPLFDTLKAENSAVLHKIIPIAGDITLPELGISGEDQQLLCDEVSVVIHSAATVKFDEPLKLSINVNVNGTRRLLDLCKRMKNLVSLVHVSTAYANCERAEIDEIIYPTPADPQRLSEMIEWMDEDILNTITPVLIGTKPNTYTYTKAIAEHLLEEQSNILPICIVRPSIVTATWKEPVPGWVDNMNGPTGLIAATGKGVIHSVLCHKTKVADFIPLDFPVNLIIAAAWHTSTAKLNRVFVYNCCSGAENPLLYGGVESSLNKDRVTNPVNGFFWCPQVSFWSSKVWFNVNDFFVHFVPAYLMDYVSRMSGKKQIMVRIYQKISKAATSLEFFTTHEWTFTTNNVSGLYGRMKPCDQKLFNFNVKDVNWSKYLEDYCAGIRKYVLKDDPKILPAARKHARKMFWIHKVTQIFLFFLFLYPIITF